MMKKIIDLLFKIKTDNIYLQFFRYSFVGVTSFLVDFIIYYSLINYLNINYLISAAIAFFIAVIVNYFMSTAWVFNQENIDNRVIEVNLFLLISFIGLIFTEILLYLFTDIISINYLISKIIASIIVMFWNFTARRFMFYGKIKN